MGEGGGGRRGRCGGGRGGEQGGGDATRRARGTRRRGERARARGCSGGGGGELRQPSRSRSRSRSAMEGGCRSERAEIEERWGGPARVDRGGRRRGYAGRAPGRGDVGGERGAQRWGWSSKPRRRPRMAKGARAEQRYATGDQVGLMAVAGRRQTLGRQQRARCGAGRAGAEHRGDKRLGRARGCRRADKSAGLEPAGEKRRLLAAAAAWRASANIATRGASRPGRRAPRHPSSGRRRRRRPGSRRRRRGRPRRSRRRRARRARRKRPHGRSAPAQPPERHAELAPPGPGRAGAGASAVCRDRTR